MVSLHQHFVNKGFYAELSRGEDGDSYLVTPSLELDVVLYESVMEATKSHLVSLMKKFEFSTKNISEEEDYIVSVEAFNVTPDVMASVFKNFFPGGSCLSFNGKKLLVDVRCASPLDRVIEDAITSYERSFRDAFEEGLEANLIPRNTKISIEKSTEIDDPCLIYRFTI